MKQILFNDDYQTHEIFLKVDQPVPDGALMVTVTEMKEPQ